MMKLYQGLYVSYVQVFRLSTQPNALKGYDTSRYICEKCSTCPRYIFIATSVKDNLQQNGSTIHQYLKCTKAGHWVIR